MAVVPCCAECRLAGPPQPTTVGEITRERSEREEEAVILM